MHGSLGGQQAFLKKLLDAGFSFRYPQLEGALEDIIRHKNSPRHTGINRRFILANAEKDHPASQCQIDQALDLLSD